QGGHDLSVAPLTAGVTCRAPSPHGSPCPAAKRDKRAAAPFIVLSMRAAAPRLTATIASLPALIVLAGVACAPPPPAPPRIEMDRPSDRRPAALGAPPPAPPRPARTPALAPASTPADESTEESPSAAEDRVESDPAPAPAAPVPAASPCML